MNSAARWAHVKALFERAVSQGPAERAALLEQATDEWVRREVASLLLADEWMRTTFLERPATLPAPSASVIDGITDYEAIDVLGQGGMGIVYRARHRISGSMVALKTVSLRDERLLAGIRREIQVLAGIDHPGVVRIVDHGVVATGFPWYAMALCEGVPLGRRAGDPLTLVARLCDPLSWLHGEGIVHGDLKPENIIVGPDGEPVIVDFGLISRFGSRATFDDSLGPWALGTPAYMAPEQARGEVLDARADLYSLGCILYELLAGRPPFSHDEPLELIRLHQEQLPEPLDCAPPLKALVARLLAKNPQNRIGYADDVARALAELRPDVSWAAPAARDYLYRPRLSGRDQALSRLADRTGEVVCVSGPSGIGKTRFALELAREAQRRQVRVLTGECSFNRAPLEPLRRPLLAIADAYRARGSTIPHAVLLSAHVPGLVDPAHASLELPPLPARDARSRLFNALSEILLRVAEQQPTLLILDDLHWADDLTLGFLEQLDPSGSSLTVVALYRSEEAHHVGPALAASETLQPLDGDGVNAIVTDMLAVEPPEGFVAFLEAQTEGNPFFIAEYLHSAVAVGALVRRDGVWRVRAWEDLPLPSSLHDLLSQRLEDLPTEMLETAAVLGRHFDATLLGRLTAQDLLPLFHREILMHAPDGAIRFTHDKIREVAYAQIPAERRRALHRRVAEALGPDGNDNELADHWERAGEHAIARGHWLRAARSAVRRYALGDAGRYYQAFLRLAADGVERIEALCELAGDVQLVQGEISEARATLRVALDGLGSVGSPLAEGAVHRRLSRVALSVDHDTEAAMAHARVAQQAYVAAADRPGECSIMTQIAGIHLSAGRLQAARRSWQDALELARDTGQRQQEGVIRMNIGLTHRDRGEWAAAERQLRGALSIHREVGHRLGEAQTLLHLAFVQWLWGRPEAQDNARAALTLSRELGYRRWEGISASTLGSILTDHGLPESAREMFSQALAIHRSVQDRAYEAETQLAMASLERRYGDPLVAEQLLARAEATCGSDRDRILVLAERGLLSLVQDHPDAAEAAHHDGEGLMTALDFPRDGRHGRALDGLRRAIEQARLDRGQ